MALNGGKSRFFENSQSIRQFFTFITLKLFFCLIFLYFIVFTSLL